MAGVVGQSLRGPELSLEPLRGPKLSLKRVVGDNKGSATEAKALRWQVSSLRRWGPEWSLASLRGPEWSLAPLRGPELSLKHAGGDN